ncbi:MAG: helix-turn-helix transcriptional regulator, partial [Candidatus Thorarchaeota archaeon]
MNSEAMITGPLQTKILVSLRDREMTGMELMKNLRIKSPGTIYPVLEVLRERGLISQREERDGSIRRKISFLTDEGNRHLRRHLMASAKWYCCDVAEPMNKILSLVGNKIDVKSNTKVLSTFEHEGVKALLDGSKVVFSEDLSLPLGEFDLVLSFLGIGCIMGKENEEINAYASQLYRTLKPGGSIIILEIEKTDNIFAEILFREMFGLDVPPGMSGEELKETLD